MVPAPLEYRTGRSIAGSVAFIEPS
jgi:hypothetical protein